MHHLNCCISKIEAGILILSMCIDSFYFDSKFNVSDATFFLTYPGETDSQFSKKAILAHTSSKQSDEQNKKQAF